MYELVPVFLIFLFIPLALAMRSLRSSRLSVFICAGLSVFFIVSATVGSGGAYFKLFMAFIGIAAAIRFARYSGMIR